jgi:hypothetical protein
LLPKRKQSSIFNTIVDRLTRLQAFPASLWEAAIWEHVADAILTRVVVVLGAIAGVVTRLAGRYTSGTLFVPVTAQNRVMVNTQTRLVRPPNWQEVIQAQK